MTGSSKKKLLSGLIIYLLILGAYIEIAISTVNQWRQTNIESSPTVYITSTGVKYHNSFHYQGRTSIISLFEAVEKGYSACKVCHPPEAPVYTGKPGFYFYHWFLISIALSLIYWITFNRIKLKV